MPIRGRVQLEKFSPVVGHSPYFTQMLAAEKWMG